MEVAACMAAPKKRIGGSVGFFPIEKLSDHLLYGGNSSETTNVDNIIHRKTDRARNAMMPHSSFLISGIRSILVVKAFCSNVFFLAMTTCERCVFCNHKTTECVACAVWECGLDTRRLSFPSTAVTIRKAIALYLQNPRMSVRETQSRDLNYRGVKTYAKVLT